MNAALIVGQVSLLHSIEPSNHSVSNHPSSPPPPTWFCVTGLTVARLHHAARTHSAEFRSTSLGLHLSLAGSPRRPAESSSSSYGLAVHLRLLSTSSHENAVTFSYRVQVKPRQGLPPRKFDALAGALGVAGVEAQRSPQTLRLLGAPVGRPQPPNAVSSCWFQIALKCCWSSCLSSSGILRITGALGGLCFLRRGHSRFSLGLVRRRRSRLADERRTEKSCCGDEPPISRRISSRTFRGLQATGV